MSEIQLEGDKLETLVIGSLVHSEALCRKMLPYLKEDYFSNPGLRQSFSIIQKFITTYNSLPTKESIEIELDSKTGLKQGIVDETSSSLTKIFADSTSTFVRKAPEKWVVETSEKFCRERAIYLAITKSIDIIDGSSKGLSKGDIPKLLQDALAVTFDPSVGHDYLEDAASRYDFYHQIERRVGTQLTVINRITKGGFAQKSLSCFLAGTGVGKSLAMCSLAAGNLVAGKNVLYITMEMAQERISERIDANLLDIDLDNLKAMRKEKFLEKIEKIRRQTVGKLIVKEYPTGTANVNHFRALLNELLLKKNFKPDIIYVDYLNICGSSRSSGSDNMYSHVKNIAEELRGLAMEFGLPIVTATQTNRGGQNASDIDFSEVSESHGLSMTVDFLAAIISTEELEKLGVVRFKQLKNRWGAIDDPRFFDVLITRSKMRLTDTEADSQHKPSINKSSQEDDEPSGYVAPVVTTKAGFDPWSPNPNGFQAPSKKDAFKAMTVEKKAEPMDLPWE